MNAEWPTVRFDEAFDVNPVRPIKRLSEAPHVAMEDIDSYRRNFSATREKIYTGSGSKFQNGDTLLARITPCLENGKTALVDSLPNGVVGHGSTELIVISGKPEISDDLFAYYFLISPQFRTYAIGQMSGSSGRQRVPTDAVARYELNLPPLPEQKAIARVLGSLDDKIELNRQMNATLEALAQTLFRAWFVDFEPVKAKAAGLQPVAMDAATAALFPSEFEDSALGPIPKGWRVGSIYEVADVIYGAPFSSKLFNALGNGVPLLRIRDLAAHAPQISTTENHPKGTLIKAGDIVVGMDGEFRVHHWQGEPVWLNQRLCTFRPKNNAGRKFVSLSLVAPMNFYENSIVGTTVIHLGKSNIDRIKIVIPSDSILAKFGKITESLLDRIIANSFESRTLAQMRDALLPRLISGQVRVPEAMAEVEATV